VAIKSNQRLMTLAKLDGVSLKSACCNW